MMDEMGGLRRDKGSGGKPLWLTADKRWRATYTDPRTGKRAAVYSRTHGRVGAREVSKLRDEALRAIEAGLSLGEASQTLAQFLERWLSTAAKQKLRARSWERYAGMVRLHIVPALGEQQLGRLRPQHIADLYARLATPATVTISHARSTRNVQRAMSPASIRYLHAVLHGALEQAVAWRILALNPADGVTLPRKSSGTMTPLSPEQARVFLDAIVGKPLEALFTLAIATGMRQGELLGLTWGDVDRDRLHVRHTLSRIGQRWWLDDPKTPGSSRVIELTAPTVDAIRQHRLRQAEQLLAIGHRVTDADLVFTDDAGAPLHGRHVTQRDLPRILTAAELPRIRFHDLRHTYATIQLAAGTNPKLVSEVLGHKDVQITLDRYSHSLPTMHRAAAERLDAILGRVAR
jgi:integrase